MNAEMVFNQVIEMRCVCVTVMGKLLENYGPIAGRPFRSRPGSVLAESLQKQPLVMQLPYSCYQAAFRFIAQRGFSPPPFFAGLDLSIRSGNRESMGIYPGTAAERAMNPLPITDVSVTLVVLKVVLPLTCSMKGKAFGGEDVLKCPGAVSSRNLLFGDSFSEILPLVK
jgi:hypothetical protein